jgi:hypothetical protein
VEIIIIQGILLTRLYAMYLGNKWILPILSALFVTTTVICVIVTSLALRTITGKYYSDKLQYLL